MGTFKKALTGLYHRMMLKILLAYGIPEKIVIKNTKAKVLTPDKLELFHIATSGLQGDTLSPFPFIITDYIMRQVIQRNEELGFEITLLKSRRVPPAILTNLSFADNVALISEGIEQTQKLLISLEKEVANAGLHLNVKKTELMAFNFSNTVELKTLGVQKMNHLENFEYTRFWMISEEKNVDIRKALARSACHRMKKT